MMFYCINKHDMLVCKKRPWIFVIMMPQETTFCPQGGIVIVSNWDVPKSEIVPGTEALDDLNHS